MMAGMGRDPFHANESVYRGCLQCIIVVAEAGRWLPGELRVHAPEIDWSGLIGMGNRLKHQYFHIEQDVVWDAVTRDFPILRAATLRLIEIEPSFAVAAE